MSDDAYERDENPTIRPLKEKLNLTTKHLLVSDVLEIAEENDLPLIKGEAEHLWRIAVTVMELQVQLVADLKNTLILGRAFPSPKWVGIDFAPFDAFNYGVSRKHAVLSLQDDNIVIRDEASLNGTFLNGKQLKPRLPYLIHTGDFVALGQFELRFDLMVNPFEAPAAFD